MLNSIGTFKALTQMIALCVEAGQSLVILGPNGVGKTEAVAQYCATAKRHVEVFLAPAMTPSTFGIEVPNREFSSYTTLRSSRFMQAPTGTVFLIDEIGHATPLVQALLGELLHSKSVQGVPLPEGCSFVLLGNRIGDTAGTFSLTRLLDTRAVTVEFLGASTEEFVGSLEKPGYLPKAGGHPLITTALRFNPELIHFTRGGYSAAEQKSTKLPTHRGWSTVSKMLQAAQRRNSVISRPVLIASIVGERAAAAMEAILQVWQDLPDLKELVPATDPVPAGAMARHLLITAIQGEATPGTVERLAPWLERWPAEEQKVFWTGLMGRSARFASTKAYNRFAQQCSNRPSTTPRS